MKTEAHNESIYLVVTRTLFTVSLVYLPGCLLYWAKPDAWQDALTPIALCAIWLTPGLAYIYKIASRGSEDYRTFLDFTDRYCHWHSTAVILFAWLWPVTILVYRRHLARASKE